MSHLSPRSNLAGSTSLLVNVLAALCIQAQTQPEPSPRSLLPNQPVERAMKGGEVHSYSIPLTVGQYLYVIVDQRGIDVALTLFGPDEKKLAEVDSPNYWQGPEPLSVIAEATGNYRLEVRSVEKTAVPGRYEARIAELRTATEQVRLDMRLARRKYSTISVKSTVRWERSGKRLTTMRKPCLWLLLPVTAMVRQQFSTP